MEPGSKLDLFGARLDSKENSRHSFPTYRKEKISKESWEGLHACVLHILLMYIAHAVFPGIPVTNIASFPNR